MKRSLAVIVLVAIAVLCAGCFQHHRVLERYRGEAAKNLLLNRPWIDEYPQKPEQRFSTYVFTDEGVGVHDRADSAYRHLLEIFLFKPMQDKVAFLFPHDRRKAESPFRLEKIQGERHFNLKLTIERDPQAGGRNYVYFSNTEWNIKNSSSMPEQIRTLSRYARQADRQ